MKKILTEIMMGVLLSLLLISSVQSIGLAVLEPTTITKTTDQTQSISSESDEKCATMAILGGLRENQKILTLETQSQLTAMSARPTDPGGDPFYHIPHVLPKLYNTTHFILHWTNGSSDGGNPDDVLYPRGPDGDKNGNGIPDAIESYGLIFEYVWDFLNNTRGFPAPPSDINEPNDTRQRNPDERYDVFLYEIPGYFGYAYPEQYPVSPSYSHIGLSNSLGTLELRQAVAAHEFFHAIQFYYDCAEEPWWQETTATYMEDEAYPGVNDHYQDLYSWFQYCDTYGLQSTEELHEYENFIFAKRLSKDFGYNIIKEIWQEMASTNGLVAIENVLVNKNSTLVSEFSKFITSNFFLEDMYADGAEYRALITGKTTFNGVWLEYQYDASTESNYTEIHGGIPKNVNRDAWMDKWACDYITLKLDPTKPRYLISFDGLNVNTNYIVKLATKNGTDINETQFQLNDTKDGSLDLNYDVFDNVTLIMANAGNTATTNPSWRVIITYEASPPINYTLTITSTEGGTTDPDPGNYTYSEGQGVSVQAIPYTGYKFSHCELDGTNESSANPYLVLMNNNHTLRAVFELLLTYSLTIQNSTGGTTEPTPGTYIYNNGTYASVTAIPNTHRLLDYWLLDDNNLSSSNPVSILITDNHTLQPVFVYDVGIDDIAITNVTSSKTNVGQGYDTSINVTVANQGTYTETFNVTVCANTTSIATQTVTLSSGNSTTLTFSWNTADFAKGNYTLSAYAWPLEGETDTDDNTLGDTWVIVTIPGDINGDFIVDIFDAILLAGSYNSSPGSPNWKPNADINGNGIVDIFDAIILANHYNQHYP